MIGTFVPIIFLPLQRIVRGGEKVVRFGATFFKFYLCSSTLVFPEFQIKDRIFSYHIIIMATPGYPKKYTHDGYRILFLVTINYWILDLRPHFLPMSKTKSRNSAFPIFRRLFSYLYSCRGLTGFLALCLGMTCIVFFRSRFSKAWIGLSPSSPRLCATSRWLIPLSNIFLISGRSPCIF